MSAPPSSGAHQPSMAYGPRNDLGWVAVFHPWPHAGGLAHGNGVSSAWWGEKDVSPFSGVAGWVPSPLLAGSSAHPGQSGLNQVWF